MESFGRNSERLVKASAIPLPIGGVQLPQNSFAKTTRVESQNVKQ
jgi:hypothetical protein